MKEHREIQKDTRRVSDANLAASVSVEGKDRPSKRTFIIRSQKVRPSGGGQSSRREGEGISSSAAVKDRSQYPAAFKGAQRPYTKGKTRENSDSYQKGEGKVEEQRNDRRIVKDIRSLHWIKRRTSPRGKGRKRLFDMSGREEFATFWGFIIDSDRKIGEGPKMNTTSD